MLVSHDKLIELGACREGIEFFDRHFKQPATLEEILALRHLPPHIIYWGYAYIGFDSDPEVREREYQAYEKALAIKNSDTYYESNNLTNCSAIVSSNHIVNSNNVFNSSFVSDSHDIYESQNINNSFEVFKSSMIKSCNKIYCSDSIGESENIAKGSNIFNSKNIFFSNNINDSTMLRSCENVKNCHFSSNVKDSTNCLFCSDLTGGDHLIFNKEVNPIFYDMIYEQYKQFVFCPKYTNNYSIGTYSNIKIILMMDFSKHYNNIPEDFFEWIKTLPNYSDEILYNITCLPKFFN